MLVSDGMGKLRRLDIGRGAFGEELEPTNVAAIMPSPIAFNADRTRFAVGVTTGDGGYGVRIHEWPSGNVLHTFKGTMQVTAIRFSADGKLLATGSYEGTVLVWDMTAARPRD